MQKNISVISNKIADAPKRSPFYVTDMLYAKITVQKPDEMMKAHDIIEKVDNKIFNIVSIKN